MVNTRLLQNKTVFYDTRTRTGSEMEFKSRFITTTGNPLYLFDQAHKMQRQC
jgi:hypothetical protein